MPNNVTFFGDTADDFDVQLRDAERTLDQWVESSHFNTVVMATASTTIAFMRFGQTFVDMLRLGNGLKQGGWRGIGADSLRLLNIAGVGGATISRLGRVLVVSQQAGTLTCTWVTTVNALRRTGQRFFGSLDELARAAGVDLAVIARQGTTAQGLRDLIATLQRMKIPINELTAPASRVVDTIIDLLKARGSGALAFGIEYQSGGRTLFHRLFATYSRLGGVTITDTTGTVYRSFEALRNTYSGAQLSAMPLYFLKNAALISVAETAGATDGISHLVFELLPLALRNEQNKTAAARGR